MTKVPTLVAIAVTMLMGSQVASLPAFGQAPVPVPAPSPVPVVAAPVYQAPVPVIVQPAPETLTIPMGTFITVDITDRLSSDRSHPGDAFTAALRQPIVVDGWVVARAGQPVIGRIVSVQKAGRIQGKSEISMELGELVLVDGQQVPIRTQMIRNEARESTGRDLAAVAATTALGALIGAGVDGGSGAAIGAGIGAGAGVAGVLATPGDSTRVYPEQVLAFRLDDPVTISTARSQHAFLAVSAADYRTVQTAPRLRVQQPAAYYAPAPSVIFVDRFPRRYRRY
jgi:hypothetical protein